LAEWLAEGGVTGGQAGWLASRRSDWRAGGVAGGQAGWLAGRWVAGGQAGWLAGVELWMRLWQDGLIFSFCLVFSFLCFYLFYCLQWKINSFTGNQCFPL